jgi:chromosome segregation ATPase
MAEKKLVTHLLVDTGDSKQNLEAIRQAATNFGLAGEQAADLFTTRFEQVQNGVGRVFQKITEGKTVSENDLRTVTQQFGQLQVAAEKVFGSMEAAPAEIRQAFDLAEDQLRSAKRAIDTVKGAADDVTDSLKKTGKQGDEAGDKLKDAFARADKQYDKLRETIDQGSPEMGEQLRRLVGIQINLRNEIERTYGSIDRATPEAIANFKRLGQQVEAAKGEVGNLTREMDKQTAGVRDASTAWRGLDSVVSDAAGKMGKFGIAAVGGFAALREGWQVGMQLNKLFGTDMSLWEEAIEKFGKKVGIVISKIADVVVAQGTVIAEGLKVWEPNYWERVTKAQEDLGTTLQDGVATVLSLEEAYQKQATAADRHKAATEAAAEAAKKAKEEADKLADAQKKLKEETEKSAEAIAKQTDEMLRQEGIAATNAANARNRAGDVSYEARQVENLNAKVAQQRLEVERLTAARGANDVTTQQARATLALLEGSLETTNRRLAEAQAETKKYEDQQRAAEAAAQRAADAIEREKQQIAEKTKEVAKASGATQQATTTTAASATETEKAATSTEKAATATAKAKTEVTAYKDEQGKWHVVSKQVTEETEKQATALANVGTKAADAKTKLSGAVAGVPNEMAAATAAVDLLTAALNRAKAAADDLAGSVGKVASAATGASNSTPTQTASNSSNSSNAAPRPMPSSSIQ